MSGMQDNIVEFHLPVRPYSPIDAYNRSAAAKGSPRYAALTASADYNGHHVTLSWNEYKRYYVAEYFWAGRVVLSRGDFATCLRAILDEYARGALGASATISIPVADEAAIKLARSTSNVIEGSIWTNETNGTRSVNRGTWWTWRHDVGCESARDMASPRHPVLIFDWTLCETTDSRQAYETALKNKYGRVYE
jgi:hypothetical protein